MDRHEIIIEVGKSLAVVRETLDLEITHDNMDEVNGKLMRLTNLIGTSSHCKAKSKRILEMARLEKLKELPKDIKNVSLVMKKIDAECYAELELFEYADRLNAGIVHSIDALRSMMSLYKTELQLSAQ